jgi:hypothetical protein
MKLAKNLLTNLFCGSITKSPNSERRFFIMKKSIIKVLSFALVAVMMCAVLVSCGGPNKDPKKAEEALKEAGYEVDYYEVNDGGIKVVIAAVKGEDSIQITYCEDKDTATKAYEQTKEAYDKLKADAEAAGEEFDYVVKQSGTMVYSGTNQAVKDAK